MDIFSVMYKDFKFDKNKPIRLFEAFSGLGTQAMALKKLGVKLEMVGISEIDEHVINSYKAIHGNVKNYGGIEEMSRFPKDIDILTWSFPCQDISLSGKQGGMEKGTQSNYGYTFLDVVKNTPINERPKVLLMENVKALLGYNFRDDWREIQLRLSKMGYTNYAEVLSATDYGVPQTRERVFIVSILGEYNYNFPKKIDLKRKLGDFLQPENEIDNKYRLTEKQVIQIDNWKAQQKPLENAKTRDSDLVQTITARSNAGLNASMVLIKDIPKISKEYSTYRLLTPIEAWRLMGISDKDFYKVKDIEMRDSQLYKQAGNAIVVDVLYYIFKELFE